jgi:hypothetical protein
MSKDEKTAKKSIFLPKNFAQRIVLTIFAAQKTNFLTIINHFINNHYEQNRTC